MSTLTVLVIGASLLLVTSWSILSFSLAQLLEDNHYPTLDLSNESGPDDGLVVWLDVRHVDPGTHTADVDMTVALPEQLLRRIGLLQSLDARGCPIVIPVSGRSSDVSELLQSDLLIQVTNFEEVGSNPNEISTYAVPFSSLVARYDTGETLPSQAFYRQRLSSVDILPDNEDLYPLEAEHLHMSVVAQLPERFVIQAPCGVGFVLPVKLIVLWSLSASPFEGHAVSMTGGEEGNAELTIHRHFSQILTVAFLALTPLAISLALLPWMIPRTRQSNESRIGMGVGLFAAVVTAPPLRSALVPTDVTGFTCVDLLLIMVVACWFAFTLIALVGHRRA